MGGRLSLHFGGFLEPPLLADTCSGVNVFEPFEFSWMLVGIRFECAS